MIALLLLLYLCSVSGSELNTTEVNYIETPDVTTPLNFNISAARTDPNFPNYKITLPKTAIFGDVFASLGPTWKFDFSRVVSIEYSFIPGIPYGSAIPSTDWPKKISDVINGMSFLDNWDRTVYIKVYITPPPPVVTPPPPVVTPPPPVVTPPPPKPITLNIIFNRTPQVKFTISILPTQRFIDLRVAIFNYLRNNGIIPGSYDIILTFNNKDIYGQDYSISSYNIVDGSTLYCRENVPPPSGGGRGRPRGRSTFIRGRVVF